MAYTPLFSFIGSSGSGKTTFIEKLIAELKNRGVKLGVIKHDAHKFEIDKPGKDSYRFKQAGADIVAISSAEKMAIVKSFTLAEETLEEIVLNYFKDVDMVITEGYKQSSIPKIEVFRECVGKPFLSENKSELIGVITDTENIPRKDVRIFGLDEVSDVAEYLVKNADFSLPEIEISGIDSSLLVKSLERFLMSFRFLKKFKKIKVNIEIEG
ncbi:molybdopterin-guanine dinucleotide biosynthesis protein B [Deferribacterales bacterium Es71-Z0220]|uniref:molybdopterin-guanine dinucleotide biosynthesis protein B n=1 Tax=Deferrivibrio essentukiensis TaxID=2880922 RepID=UPI001F61CDA6|nr:molybdopterin-guanine dinucleotide biosynthesis protein B [Deferrivibrio essentukiensis]MCB4203941.1 molybdopterin-guanine dinucleotide biosynthesis protein B [Deferrivibrio essentukiensis]